MIWDIGRPNMQPVYSRMSRMPDWIRLIQAGQYGRFKKTGALII